MNHTANLEDWNILEQTQEPVGAKPPQKVRYSHDAMIDMIVARPGISQNQLAAFFGYTPAWVSTIMSSDAFKARLANRREDVIDPALSMVIEERFKGLTERSLAVLMDKLSAPSSQISDNLALRAAELGAKTLGTGGFAPPAPSGGDYLSSLAQRLIDLRTKTYSNPITIVEGEAHEQDKRD